MRTLPAGKNIQVQDTGDLVGKRVSHLCEMEGKEQRHSAIIAIVRVPTRCSNIGRYMYTIKHDNCGDEFEFPLLNDLTS